MAKINEIIESLNLDDVISFCQNGNPNNAPEGIAEYLELLDKTRGMIVRFDKYPNDNVIVKSLMITDKLSQAKAKKIIEEAREFFWRDSSVSKDAWRNILVEKMMQVIHLAMLSVKDVSDADRVTKMIQRQAYLLQLDKVEDKELPAELFLPQWVVYTTDAEELGLPKVDRNRIKEFIDKRVPELTEKEKNRLYQEADIIPFKALPNDEENPRKN